MTMPTVKGHRSPVEVRCAFARSGIVSAGVGDPHTASTIGAGSLDIESGSGQPGGW
jgi:hypothetical protein